MFPVLTQQECMLPCLKEQSKELEIKFKQKIRELEQVDDV